MARPRKPINHGTVAGYLQHLRRGQRTCASCRRAWREYQRPRNQRTRAEGRELRQLRAVAKRQARIAHIDPTTPEDVLREFMEGIE